MAEVALLIEEARACAGLFRLGRDVEAALRMVDLFDRLPPLFDAAPASQQQQWGTLLMETFSRQQLQDWLAVADYLQYELVALMEHGGQ